MARGKSSPCPNLFETHSKYIGDSVPTCQNSQVLSKDFLENASCCLVHSNRIRNNSGTGVSDVLKLPKSSPDTYLSLRTTALHRSLLFFRHEDFFVLFNPFFLIAPL